MREPIDLAAVERIFGLLAVMLPVLGVGLGAALQFGARRRGALATGILVGLLGPANWLLWRVYNGIENYYGLDSVKAMLLNLALFAALGASVGSDQEAQPFQMVLLVPLVIPLLFIVPLTTEPLGPAATFLGLFPLSSPVAMPDRWVRQPVRLPAS